MALFTGMNASLFIGIAVAVAIGVAFAEAIALGVVMLVAAFLLWLFWDALAGIAVICATIVGLFALWLGWLWLRDHWKEIVGVFKKHPFQAAMYSAFAAFALFILAY